MERIGKYKVLGKIGEGAMGIVYKAMDPVMERVVAVKTMVAEIDGESELRTRFFREARSAGQLSHKNIITIYDLFEENGRIYMAMEYLDGQDLRTLIDMGRRIPLERKILLMLEICEGLGHAHNKQVIHRDIKPGNIHITRSGHAKILDFGLARIASSNITKTGAVMGTPNYMSPEQIRGDQVDHRSDIFSAGAVFYELLTYRKPFPGSTFHQTFFKILESDPAPPHTVESSLPPDLSSVVLRALAKNPNDRYQAIDELVKELNRFKKTIDKRRRELHDDLRKSYSQLDQLIEANQHLLANHRLDRPEEDNTVSMILAGEVEEEEDVTKRLDFTIGYVELLELRDKASREYLRLGALVESLKRVSLQIEEATSLEKNGNLEGALQVVEKVLTEFPDHKDASTLAKRIHAEIADRARGEGRKKAFSRLLRVAREHYQRGALQKSLSIIDEALKISPKEDGALSLREKVGARLEEQRRHEEKARQAEEIFQKAVSEFSETNPEACLPLLARVLELMPDHIEATALREKAERGKKELEELAEKRRLAENSITIARKALESGKLEKVSQEIRHTRQLVAGLEEIPAVEEQIRKIEEGLRAKKEREQNIRSLLEEARTFDRSGDEEQALDRLVQLLKLESQYPQALELRKEIHARRESRQRAERERLEKIARLLDEARKSQSAGDLTKAVTSVKKVLSEDASHREAQELLERLESEIRAQKEEALARARLIADHLERGMKAFEQEDYSACEQEMSRLLALDPKHGEARDYRRQAKERVEEKREQERRTRLLSQALRSAKEALSADELDKGLREVDKALSLDPASAEGRRLRSEIEHKKVEQRKLRERRERAEELRDEARLLLKKGDAESSRRALGEALSLWPDLSDASNFQRKIEKEIARAKKKVKAEPTPSPEASKTLYIAAALVAFLALGSLVLYLVFRSPATSETETETVPTEGSTATEGATAGTEAEISRGLAAAQTYLDQKQFEEAAREAEAVLSLTADHPEARRILESGREYQARIAGGIQQVQSLIDNNQLDRAGDTLSTVLDLAPSNPEVQKLLTQLNQYFQQNADEAVRQMNAAKAEASDADAPRHAQAGFERAQRIEEEAQRFYQQKKFGEATGKYVESGDAYRMAANEARAATARAEQERLTAELQTRVASAERLFADVRSKAIEAGAQQMSTQDFDAADGLARQAQEKLVGGDLEGAQRDFQAASEKMKQAQSAAISARRGLRSRMEAARTAMESAKRASPDGREGQAEEQRARQLEQQGNLADAEAAYRRAADLYQEEARGQNERQNVLNALGQYETALESRDMAALKSVWPSLSGRAEEIIGNNFRFARSWQVELGDINIQISGDMATVTCHRLDQMVTEDGQRIPNDTPITITLQRSNGTWVIVDLR